MANAALARITAAQTITTTTELVVATIGPIATGPGDIGIWFSGDIQFTSGAGATGVTFRLRAGTTIAGTQVDTTAVIPVTAAVTTQLPFNLFDLTNISQQAGGQTYVITIQQTAATGNGTVNGGHVGVEI